jgi:hypothetical protein
MENADKWILPSSNRTIADEKYLQRELAASNFWMQSINFPSSSDHRMRAESVTGTYLRLEPVVRPL